MIISCYVLWFHKMLNGKMVVGAKVATLALDEYGNISECSLLGVVFLGGMKHGTELNCILHCGCK